MHSLRLMCQDNNLNNHGSNRFHRVDVSDNNDFVSLLIPSTLEFSNETEVRDNTSSNILIKKSYNQIIFNQFFNQSRNENNTIKRNASSLLNTAKLLSKLMINLFVDSNNRQNLRSEKPNYTMTEDERSDDYELIKWSERRTRRLRRNTKDSEEHSEEKDETRHEKKRRQNEKKDKKLRQEEKNNTRRQQNEKKRRKWSYSEEKNKKRQNRRGCKHNCRRWSIYLLFYQY